MPKTIDDKGDELRFVAFLPSGSWPVSNAMLAATCRDGESWISYLHMAFTPRAYAEMTVHMGGKPPETMRVIKARDFVQGASTYQKPVP